MLENNRINDEEYAALQEIRERGTKAFPVLINLFTCASPGSILHYHWHHEWQWMLMYEGQGTFVIDDVWYHLRPGDAVFVNSGQLHSGFTSAVSGCSHVDVIFHQEQIYGSLDIVQQYFADFKSSRYQPQTLYRFDVEGEREVTLRLQSILSAHREGGYHGDEVMVKAELTAILALILCHNLYEKKFLKNKRLGRKQDYLLLTFDYIHRNYQRKLSLQEIADNAGISVQSLCRAFKDATGTTVVDYINTYRVYISVTLLTETSIPVNVIALQCGFEDTSYFIKVFKKHKGVTPTEYSGNLQDKKFHAKPD